MKRRSKWLLWLGVTLVALGLCTAVVMGILQHRGERQASRLVEQIEAILPPRTAGVADAYSVMQMPVWSVQGTDMVALLDIPAHSVTLPVGDAWQQMRLMAHPCRFSGTAYDHSLIIGGGSKQLSCLKEMQHGDEVIVTDMQGAEFRYTVSRIRRAAHADGETLAGEAKLTLFARDYNNMEYIIVECE